MSICLPDNSIGFRGAFKPHMDVLRKRGDDLKEYALYKGEELIAIGTREELAKQRGVKPRTIYHYTLPAYQHHPRKKGESKRLVAIKLDD